MKHALGLYAKYRANLNLKRELLLEGKIFEAGGESDLLLGDLDENEFYAFRSEFTTYLRELANRFEK